jgi:hypothetical protein
MSDRTSDDMPPDISFPATLTATTDANGQPLDTGIVLLPFPFCVRARGNAIGTTVVSAPSPEDAAVTMAQVVRVANAQAQRDGFPANFYSASPGECT